MADVFLHIGLPKTGTTTIQGALDRAVRRLEAADVLFPGGTHRAQRLAVYDLLGQRVAGDGDAHLIPGALDRLLDEVARFEGRAVVVSEEELGFARAHHVARLARGLRGHRLFVVVGIRDMARTLVSAWQQSIVTGRTTRWPDFIEGVRAPGRGSVSEGTAFWLRHDPLRVIDTWATAVRPERIRVVTVPPRGSPSSTLLARFAAAVDLPANVWGGDQVEPRNVSLGAAEVEVIRRLNESVVGPLNTSQYRHVVESGIRAGLAHQGSRSLVLPAEQQAWAQTYGRSLVAELERRGYPLFGDLADLVPDGSTPSGRAPDDVTEAELLAATEAALASLALAHARLFRRYRRAFRQQEGRPAGAADLLGSTARAAGFGLQKQALRSADHSRILAWAARAYLGRASGRAPR